MAVTRPGCVLHARNKKNTFENLLNYLPNSVEAVIAVICGNDWYRNESIIHDNICNAAKRFADALNSKCKYSYAVVGASAKV